MSIAELQSDPMLPTIDLLRVLDRLPAELRAKLRWVRPVVQEAVRTLRSAPLTDERIDAAARSLARPMVDVAGVLLKHLSREELAGVLNEASESLRADVPAGLDDDSVDTFEWCVAILDAVRRLFMSAPPRDDAAALAAATDEELGLALADPLEGGLLRGQALLFAAVLDPSAPPSSEDVETSADLIDEAYLQLCGALDALRADGIAIDPFADDTRSDRGKRALRAATALRETLSDGDARQLSSARLRALR